MDAPNGKSNNKPATPAQAKGAPVRLVLSSPRRIDGKLREPGYVLLEGVCQKNVTTDDIVKACMSGSLAVSEDVF